MNETKRTKKDVLAARRNSVSGGCCNRFADQQACDCLERAEDDEPMTHDLTVTPEYRAFLASIIAAPEDDAPRLECADWLEEQGDVARAKFIRKQIEQEVATLRLMWLIPFEGILGCQPHHCCRYAEKREAKVVALDGTSLTFRRGFIEAVTCDWLTWREHGDAILAAQPVTTAALADRLRTSRSLMAIGSREWRHCLLGNLAAACGASFLRHPQEARSRIVEILRTTWPRVLAWRVLE